MGRGGAPAMQLPMRGTLHTPVSSPPAPGYGDNKPVRPFFCAMFRNSRAVLVVSFLGVEARPSNHNKQLEGVGGSGGHIH